MLFKQSASVHILPQHFTQYHTAPGNTQEYILSNLLKCALTTKGKVSLEYSSMWVLFILIELCTYSTVITIPTAMILRHLKTSTWGPGALQRNASLPLPNGILILSDHCLCWVFVLPTENRHLRLFGIWLLRKWSKSLLVWWRIHWCGQKSHLVLAELGCYLLPRLHSTTEWPLEFKPQTTFTNVNRGILGEGQLVFLGFSFS